LLIVLGVVLLVLAVLGVASLLNANRDTDGRSTPETTSAPAGGAVNDDGDSEAPGNPPMTGIPTHGKFVQVDESVYLNRPAVDVVDMLQQDGLMPVVRNQHGETPQDPTQCIVVDVAPEGRQQVGTEVRVRCEEDEEPPR